MERSGLTRNICVMTTTRADYGLLYWLMKEIDDDSELELSIVVTGTHLAPEFGMTIKHIESDGFHISRSIEMLISTGNHRAILRSMGVELISLADVLSDINPDIIVVLGDRFEIVPVALAAVIMGIPLAHIHGGETSEGAIDESFRHAVTKLAAIHFPATDIYKKRIEQMGESSRFIFNYGAPGLDSIYRLSLLNREQLEEVFQFSLAGVVALVTYHPVTTEPGSALLHLEELIKALKNTGVRAIFTKANADTDGVAINQRLAEVCKNNPEDYKLFDSLGQMKYLSCLKSLDLMVGNSSSGLIEAPSFRLPVVNIGERQKGRIKAKNVLDVGNSAEEISGGITRVLSVDFKILLEDMENPYDIFRDGKTSWRIKEKLKSIEISQQLTKKEFQDIY